jgi:hypothetical protein
MRRYEVYGARLESDLEFPELPPADGPSPAARWRVAVVDALPPMREARELGATRIYGDVHARLVAHAAGHRVTIDDTGHFDISSDRRTIRWERREASRPGFVRAHCVGRVLATALFLDGLLPLHGSAVEGPDGVLAFVAPKGHGKSSLALALTEAGARLVTDDTVPVELAAGGARAWPGVQSLRVRADALAGLGVGGPTLDTHEGKRVVGPLPPDRLMRVPRALSAIYLLEPVVAGAPGAAARERLPETLAAIAVVAHVKIGEMLGATAAGALLARAAAIVRDVPVYRLAAVRDLGRLPEVARQVLAWHEAP